jgi:small subunit ribosomal protein S3
MGQKVHPNAFRLGIYKPWQARWYADKDYTEQLLEDVNMRRLILNRLRNAGISKVETERSANQATVIIWTAKPGIVIGKGGASVDQLRDDLEKMTGKKVRVTIQEIKHPELDAMLVAQNVAAQLERRIAFRRAVKQSVLRTMRAGAKGVKIMVSGRLGGAEMSRREWDRDGRVPLHTLKADIDFGQTEARTTFGRIGVSVWVYLGDFDLTSREETFDEIPARQLLDETRAGALQVQAAPTNGAAAEAAPALGVTEASAAVPAPAAAPPEPSPAPPAPAPAAPKEAREAAARPKRAPRAAAPGPAAEADAKPKPAPRKAGSRAQRTPAAVDAEAPVTNTVAEPATPEATAPAPESAEPVAPEAATENAKTAAPKPARKPAARRPRATKTEEPGGDAAKDEA